MANTKQSSPSLLSQTFQSFAIHWKIILILFAAFTAYLLLVLPWLQTAYSNLIAQLTNALEQSGSTAAPLLTDAAAYLISDLLEALVYLLIILLPLMICYTKEDPAALPLPQAIRNTLPEIGKLLFLSALSSFVPQFAGTLFPEWMELAYGETSPTLENIENVLGMASLLVPVFFVGYLLPRKAAEIAADQQADGFHPISVTAMIPGYLVYLLLILLKYPAGNLSSLLSTYITNFSSLYLALLWYRALLPLA